MCFLFRRRRPGRAWAALAALLLAPSASAQVVEIPSPLPYYGGQGWFGHWLSWLPDVDGDGAPELLISTPEERTGPPPAGSGRAYVLSGRTRALLHLMVSPLGLQSNYFGYTIAGAPDLNGDGVPDVLVTSLGDPVPDFPRIGRVYAFSGADASLFRTWDNPGPFGGGAFGEDVAVLGDVTGDGFPDIAVGQPAAQSGRAHVFSGAPDAAVWRIFVSPFAGAATGDDFGNSVTLSPDIDGDGFDEVVCGAPYEDLGRQASGYAMSTGSTAMVFELSGGPAPPPYVGFASDSIGDVDGDGVRDVLCSHLHGGLPGGAANEGEAAVFSGATGDTIYYLYSPAPVNNGQFGYSISSVPDLNGDGIDDVLVGARREAPFGLPVAVGAAHTYCGASGRHLRTVASPNARADANGASFFGRSCCGVPDINGDGRGEFMVGAPEETCAAARGCDPPIFGRVYLFLSCPGDYNADGRATPQDVFDFLAAWFSPAPPPGADHNRDGRRDIGDIFSFLGAWFAGCP